MGHLRIACSRCGDLNGRVVQRINFDWSEATDKPLDPRRLCMIGFDDQKSTAVAHPVPIFLVVQLQNAEVTVELAAAGFARVTMAISIDRMPPRSSALKARWALA